MKKMKNTAILFRRLMLFGLGGFQVILILLTVAMILEGVIWTGIMLLLCLEIFLIGFGVFLLYHVPVVTLEEDGVSVKKLFYTYFYPWNSIQQAGYQWIRGTWGSKYKDLVLVPPNGSPRCDDDKTFALRNAGKLIHLPISEEVRLFVEQHYGPLDFDLTDGNGTWRLPRP